MHKRVPAREARRRSRRTVVVALHLLDPPGAGDRAIGEDLGTEIVWTGNVRRGREIGIGGKEEARS
jgi:hypothetical protein